MGRLHGSKCVISENSGYVEHPDHLTLRWWPAWKSGPNPHEEVNDEIERERLWLGLDCDMAVIHPEQGRREAPKQKSKWARGRFEERNF